MDEFSGAATRRAAAFAAGRGASILRRGAADGLHGSVFLASNARYLKAFHARAAFDAEREVYRRLQARGVVEVRGFQVPQLLGADGFRGVLELSRVEPPFVLDFASATIDETPERKWADQPGRIQAAWARAEEAFSSHTPAQWAEVQRLYEVFGDRFGVWMLDLHPGNIAFGDGAELPRRQAAEASHG